MLLDSHSAHGQPSPIARRVVTSLPSSSKRPFSFLLQSCGGRLCGVPAPQVLPQKARRLPCAARTATTTVKSVGRRRIDREQLGSDRGFDESKMCRRRCLSCPTDRSENVAP